MKKDSKLKAYVVEPIDGDWSMVNQTEYFEDGRWVIGLVLITSLEDVMKSAWKQKVAVLPQSILERLNNKIGKTDFIKEAK